MRGFSHNHTTIMRHYTDIGHTMPGAVDRSLATHYTGHWQGKETGRKRLSAIRWTPSTVESYLVCTELAMSSKKDKQRL